MPASQNDSRQQHDAAARLEACLPGGCPADARDAEPAGPALTGGPFHVGRLHILDRENAVQRAREARQAAAEPRLPNSPLPAEKEPAILSALQQGRTGFQAAFAEGLGLSGNREERTAELREYLQSEQKLFYKLFQNAACVRYAGSAGENAPESFSPSFFSASRSPSFSMLPSPDPDAEPTVGRREALDAVVADYLSCINAGAFQSDGVGEKPDGLSVWEREYARLLNDEGNPHWISVKEPEMKTSAEFALFPGLPEKAGVFIERAQKDRRGRARVKKESEEKKRRVRRKEPSFLGRIFRFVVVGCALGFAYLVMLQKGCAP